jgi:hypothetical protein
MTSGEVLSCCKSVMYTQVLTLLLYSYTARSSHATVSVTAAVEQGWTYFWLVRHFHIARVFTVIIVTYCHRLESVWRLGYWLEVRGIVVRFPAGQTCFTLLPKSIPALGPILPYVQWVPGTLSPRMERPGREASYSHLSNAEVKIECCYAFTPTYAFMVYAGAALHTLYCHYLGVIWLKLLKYFRTL